MRSWLITVAANLVFGQEAIDAYKNAKHPKSPGGESLTVEEMLEISGHSVAHMSTMSGIKPQVDITLLPSRERMKELLTNAGFTVIDKGTEHPPTGTPLVASLVADAPQPSPAEAATDLGDDGNAEEDGEDNGDNGEAPKSRRRRK